MVSNDILKDLSLFQWEDDKRIDNAKKEIKDVNVIREGSNGDRHLTKRFVRIHKSYSKYRTIHPDKSYDKSHNELVSAIHYILMVEGNDIAVFFDINDLDVDTLIEIEKVKHLIN